MLQYSKPIKTIISDHINYEKSRRTNTDIFLQETEETDKLYTNAILVYEKCLIQTFINCNLPIEFLFQESILSIDEYPWRMNYVFNKSISMTVEIPVINRIEIEFAILKTTIQKDNIIYLHRIDDEFLSKVNWNKIPISYMVTEVIAPGETLMTVKLANTLPRDLHYSLLPYHEFIDLMYPTFTKILNNKD